MGHELSERRGYSGEVAGIIRVTGKWMGVHDPRSAGGSAGF
jgi:gamma-glutamyltranspeptidase